MQKISLFHIINAIADAIDLASDKIGDHHKKVAVICDQICRELRMSDSERFQTVVAAFIHDCGSLPMTNDERHRLMKFEIDNPERHAVNGFEVLKNLLPLKDIAYLVRYHHTYWFEGAGRSDNDFLIPLGSHVIHLADRVAVAVSEAKEILSQKKSIRELIISKTGMMFNPVVSKAFFNVSEKENFWFDILYADKVINRLEDENAFNRTLSFEELEDFAGLMSRLIDFRSGFTFMHSRGVAVVAALLGHYMGFSSHNCRKMKIAGLVHDLGKMAIPVEILEKPSGLTVDEFNIVKSHTYLSYQVLSRIGGFEEMNEWASYHHEKLDGTGYPFHLDDSTLSLGSRIMAVADIYVALAEDRPYRAGMKKEEIVDVMNIMGSEGKLEKKVINVLFENMGEIDNLRSIAQSISESTYDNLDLDI